jgi:tryptophanyl-tRNA synthetase
MARTPRVLSGMRPTGPLHLGHYFGALANWLKLQQSYECFYFVADWHALTTHYTDDARRIRDNTTEIVLDWLAVGLDPERSTLFVQSAVPEHAELHLLLSMITPLEWLERVPTYREQIAQLRDRDLGTYGFLGYPLLQTADIVIYDADFVPVGEDQLPHIELAREIVRRFNHLFGLEVDRGLLAATPEAEMARTRLARLLEGRLPAEPFDENFLLRLQASIREEGIENFLLRTRGLGRWIRYRPVLREPQALLTETPRFPGTDGRRMAKSYGNAIWLKDDPETVRQKVAGMLTDPQRVRRSDPGRPEICPVFAYHQAFSPPEVVRWSEQGCRTAGIGCVECKKAMAEHLVRWLEPIQSRRQQYARQPETVQEILRRGSVRARRVARRTMARVRRAIFGAPTGARAVAAPAVSQGRVGSEGA